MPPPQQEAREGASGSVPTHITPPHKSPAIPLLIYLLAKSYLESEVSAGCFCAQSSPDTATRVPAKHLARIFPIPACSRPCTVLHVHLFSATVHFCALSWTAISLFVWKQ